MRHFTGIAEAGNGIQTRHDNYNPERAPVGKLLRYEAEHRGARVTDRSSERLG